MAFLYQETAAVFNAITELYKAFAVSINAEIPEETESQLSTNCFQNDITHSLLLVPLNVKLLLIASIADNARLKRSLLTVIVVNKADATFVIVVTVAIR